MKNILINILLVLIFLIIFKLTIVPELFSNEGIQSGSYTIMGPNNFGQSTCDVKDGILHCENESDITIDLGRSDTNEKTVELPDDNMTVDPLPINTQDPSWSDKFEVKVMGRNLKVKRTDSDGGWVQELRLKGKKQSNSKFNIMNLDNGKYAIKKGEYFCSLKDNEVTCNKSSIDNSSTFFINNLEGDFYSIKGMESNMFCSNKNSKIACNKESVGNMERFKLTLDTPLNSNMGQKIDINVGSSSRREKEIELPKLNLKINPIPKNTDLFDTNIKFDILVEGKTLKVTRMDKDGGWNDDLVFTATEDIEEAKSITDVFKYRTIAIGKNDRYIKINQDGSIGLSKFIGKDESFEVVNVGGSVFALKSRHNKYLSIGKTSISSNHYISNNEKFVILLLSKFTLLKSLSNKTFLSINSDSTVNSIGYTTEGCKIDIKGLKLKEEKPDEELEDSYFDEKIPEDTSGYSMKGQATIEKKCSFIPRGPSLLACQDRCLNKYDNHLWGGPECTTDVCESICKTCVKPEDCLWLDKDVPKDYRPEQLNIKGYPSDGKIKITWQNIPSEYSPNSKYALLINNLSKPNSNPRIDVLSDNNCTNCEYYITNLENLNRYQVKVVAKNNYGYSDNSNTLILIPKSENTNPNNSTSNSNQNNENVDDIPPVDYDINEYALSQRDMNNLAMNIITDRIRPVKQLDINLFT